MTELEIEVLDSLFKDGLLRFYIRYIDNTLALIKKSDIDNELGQLNCFEPSLNFTVDKCNDGVVHYMLFRRRTLHFFFFFLEELFKSYSKFSIFSKLDTCVDIYVRRSLRENPRDLYLPKIGRSL